MIDTPTTKTGAKRSSNSIDSVAVDDDEAGQTSATKPTRVVRVKIEHKDDKDVELARMLEPFALLSNSFNLHKSDIK